VGRCDAFAASLMGCWSTEPGVSPTIVADDDPLALAVVGAGAAGGMLICAFAGPIYMTGWQRRPCPKSHGDGASTLPFLFGWLAWSRAVEVVVGHPRGLRAPASAALSGAAMIVLAAALIFTGNLRIGRERLARGSSDLARCPGGALREPA